MHFLSRTSMYVVSLISIPFALFKIWTGQASIMKKIVMGRLLNKHTGYECGSCVLQFHQSIYQVLFQSLLYFPRYGPDKHPLWKKWLWGDNSINISWIMVLVFWTSSHEHLWCTKFNFNPFSTFQDMAWTSNQYEHMVKGR